MFHETSVCLCISEVKPHCFVPYPYLLEDVQCVNFDVL